MSLLRPAGLFVLFTYGVLSAAPFIALMFGRPIDHAVSLFLMTLLCWVIVWAVFKRPVWFHCFLIPAFVALPIEIYLQAYYGQGISTHHLGIIFETSPKEALEFLGSKVWLLVVVIAGVVGWWWLSFRAARNALGLAWTTASRWIVLVVLGLLLFAMEYHPKIFLQGGRAASASIHGDKGLLGGIGGLSGWPDVSFDLKTFGRTWPFGLSVRGYEFWKERRYLAELAHKSSLFTFGARQAAEMNLPQIVVMVIGESSRYDRWALNGYQRETNPLLKEEENLVSLSNVVTAVSATRLSVPVLVSRKPATQSLQAGFSEKSFLTAFKEAGFKTWWLSNQMSFGQFDTPVSVFAKEADVTEFLNLGGFTNQSSYDEVLLAPLKRAMNDPAQKKLIVLHSLGSHWNYSHRYPKEFDKWQPSLYGMANPAYTDAAMKEQLNNSYDNSVLYTDWFLSRVIGALKTSGLMASMIYVSDHGQALYDGTCKLAFHGHNTQYEFHVPALVWYSELYRLTHPVQVTQLQKNRRARLATENIFHSLLDMADIRYASEQLEWSFLNRKFKQHKRYVDSYGWTDYDNAYFKGDCREVIDKGKPLPQAK